MIASKENFELLERLLPVLRVLPEGTYFDLGATGELQFQAETQAKVRVIRAAFPGVTVWVKQVVDTLEWWEYTTVYEGFAVRIYACREAPPACRKIEEEVLVEEQVPVTFEARMVKRTKVRWECPEVNDGQV